MGNDLMENTTENIFSSQIGDVDEREEGEIVDDFEYIISSDEALTVRKRIAELESKNDEIEKIDLISRSFANGYDCASISEIIAKFRTPSNEYYHHFPRSQLNRTANLIRSSSSESERGSFSLNRKEDRKRRKFPIKNSSNIRSTYYKSNNHQQFRKDINSKRYVPNKKRRHNFDYTKFSSHIDAHEDSTDDYLKQTDSGKCRKEVKSQESNYSKNHDHYNKKKPLKNHIKRINGLTNGIHQNYLQNKLKDSKEICKNKELVQNSPVPPEEKIIEIPNVSEEVKLCNNTNDKSDSQEEEELRLIALKSAMIQRHLKRKRRNAELAYSPTDFDEMLASVEADKNSNLVFEVDLDESITEMEISPTTSPRFSPIPIDEDFSDRSVEFVAQSNAIDTKPVDMDIVNTESESENVIYSISNKMFAIDPIVSSSDCKITDLGPSISYNGMDYGTSLQYGLYVPEMQYQLNIPPPPLPPVLNDCIEVIPPPPLFCNYNELAPPPPPPILIPLERQNDEISDETEIIDLCNDTVEENIITKDITEIKSEDTSCINENQQNKDNSEGEEEEALRALLLSKIQSGKTIKKENDIYKTESTVNPELKLKDFNNTFKNDESPQAQTQSILKEAVRRLKMISEGNDEGGVKSEIEDKSDKNKDHISLEKEENEMEKNFCLMKLKEKSPNKNSTLDHLLEERIAELVRQEKATEVCTSATVSDVNIAKEAGKLDTITVSCVSIGEEKGKLDTQEKNLTTELNLENKTKISDIKSNSSLGREQSKSKSEDKINVRIGKTKNLTIKNNVTNVITGNKEIDNVKKDQDSSKFISELVASNLSLTPKMNGIKQIPINKNILSSFDNQLKNTVNHTFPTTTKQPSTSTINSIQKSTSASTFVSTVRKIIKPNKIINTNMNLKRKTVENNPNTKFKLTKMSNAIDRSVNTSPFGKTASTTLKTSRLVTPSEIPKPVVQKIIINLQTSESDIEEDEEENNLTNMKQTSSLDINTNYIDNASPLSLPMDSRSNTPIRVSSPTILTEKTMINTNTIKVRNDIFEQKLEIFLKNIRDKSKTNMKDNHPATTNHRRIVSNDKIKPSAVRHLPIAAQYEYGKLIERMKLLEKQRENKLKIYNGSNRQSIQSKNINNKTISKITFPKNKTIATGDITNPNSKTIDISNQNKKISAKQNMMNTEKDRKHNSSPIKDTTAVFKNKSIDSKDIVENIASNHTATIPSPTKANTAMILNQESKRRVTLRLQENSYNKSSAIILNKLDSSLKLVNNVKTYKIAEIKYEKQVKELEAKLEEAKLNLKKQKEKLEEICPEVSRSNEVLTNMRKRRLKLFRVATNLGKSIVGENYSLNNELNKEIKIKFNDLAREIKVVNSISHKNIDTFETKQSIDNENLVSDVINQHLSSNNDKQLNESPKHLSTENDEKLNEPIILKKFNLNESIECCVEQNCNLEKVIEREIDKSKNNEGSTTKHEEPSISDNNDYIEKNSDTFKTMENIPTECAKRANNNIEINTNSLMGTYNADIEKNINNVTDVNKSKEQLYIELAKPANNNIEINTNSLMGAYNADIEKNINNVTDINKTKEQLYIELAKPAYNNIEINTNSLMDANNADIEKNTNNVTDINKTKEQLYIELGNPENNESNESVLNNSKIVNPLPQTQISEEEVHLSIINAVEDLNAPDNGFDEIGIKEISNKDNEAISGCFQQYTSPLMNSDKIESAASN